MTSTFESKPKSPPFIISRIFDAPRQLVWDACTKPEHLQNWFSPKGFTGRVAKMDFRPGGMYLYCLKSPEGHEMWGKALYREITAPERLVYINAFSDAQGGTTRHPLSPTWPLEMLTTFTFTEKDGKTTLTIKWELTDTVTVEERTTFDNAHAGMTQGWTGSLDNLTEYLKTLTA